MKLFSHIIRFTLLFVPTMALAQVTDIQSFQGFLYVLLQRLGYLFWIASIAVFFWGLVKFIRNAGDTDAHEAGKSLMIWGIISFLVLVSLWAIVRILLVDTLGINASDVRFIDKNGNVR